MSQVAIVTGGSRGIGRSIVGRLAKEGYTVYFNYAHRADDAQTTCDQVESFKGKAIARQVDVTDHAAVKAWIDDIKDEHGVMNVLINNAGIKRDKALMMMSDDDWGDVINTNLNGMYHLTRQCVATMMKNKSGAIVNISSVSGVMGLVGQCNYSATKGAMNSFTKALAKEVARYFIRVNAVAPGFIDTEMTQGFNEKQNATFQQTIPQRRFGSPSDVADIVSFLVDQNRSGYVTGQVIPVDGGLCMR